VSPIRLILAALLLFSFAVQPACADQPASSEQKQRDIARLIEMTGAQKLGLQFAQAINQQFSQALRNQDPNLPDRAYAILEEELVKVFSANIGSFIEVIVPVYDKHFTHEEILGLIAFYESDLGKKAIEVLPQVMNESMLAGQQWGRELAPTLVEHLKARFRQEGIPFPG